MPVDDFPDRAARLAAAGELPPAAAARDDGAPVADAPAHAAGQPPRVFGVQPHGHDLVEHVPIRLDPELQRRLEARAAADGTSASDVVRRALNAYLDGA
jgi:hypothetical protein